VSDRSSEAEPAVDPAGDERGLPWGTGRPIVKYPGLALIWGTVLAFLTLDGDTEALVGFSLAIAVNALCIFSAVLMLRRRLPQYYLHRTSPVTVIIWSLAFIAVSATVLFDLAVNPPTDVLDWKGGFWVAGLLIVASIFVQLLSMTDAWPDWLRPRLETPEWRKKVGTS
jgi:amino acid transporter